ncbi:MAG: rod shape-determining protein MreC [Candidatus Omnitrophica bacterium]|nr:rod shape-determining protein MreC [Candidatus Omnitrophota bacterium]
MIPGRRKATQPVFFLLLILAILFLPSALKDRLKHLSAGALRPVLVLSRGVTGSLMSVRKIPRALKEQRDFSRLSEANRQLVVRLKELGSENERLRKLLAFRDQISWLGKPVVAARVIGRTPAGWRRTLVLDKGTKDGIKSGMPVMSSGSLLGMISGCGARTSEVRLVTHPEFRVGALLEESRQTGLVYGSAAGECRMKYLSVDADVEPEESVQTAGFSPGFPKGIPIGKIAEIWKEPGRVYKVAHVKLFADLDRIEEVLCVSMD